MSRATAAAPLSRLWIAIAVAIGLAVLVAANVHLVFVSFVSQPDCVAHSKAVGDSGTYRAAKSAC